MKKKKILKIKRTIYLFCIACTVLISLIAGYAYADNAVVDMSKTQAYIKPNNEKSGISVKDFTDVSESAWYYQYVKFLVETGVIKGTSAASFSPGGTFTVAESSAVIARYLGLERLANDYKYLLVQTGCKGAEKWYSGYLQVLYNAGIIDADKYGITVQNNFVNLTDESAVERPVKRYEFCNFITKSFELDKTEIISQSSYHEIQGHGHEFITGGAYDKDSYLAYEKYISDFEKIPETSRENVLKAYYNGIFNGDEYGNFNPENNLTRAEMSKVISVITDNSKRTRIETRTLPKWSEKNDLYFISDGWKEKTFPRYIGYYALEEYTKNIDVKVQKTGISLSYVHKNIAPENYYAEVIFYEKNGNAYKEIERLGGYTESFQNTPYSVNVSGSEIQVLFLLRNRSSLKVEGALLYTVDKKGNTVLSNMYRSVL